MKTTAVTLSAVLRSDGERFNPPYFLNAAVDYYNGLTHCPYSVTTLGQECEDAFAGNIFSRRFVKNKEHGVPYLTPTEMLKADMSQAKLLSKKQADALSYLRVRSGWILISCSGSAALGSVALANERHEQMIATHDLIRFVPQERNLKVGVIFAFLRSKYGKTTLTHSQYGSCILHIIPDHVKSIQIPVFPAAFQKKVHQRIMESARLREEADAALKRAVALFERESRQKGLGQKCRTGVATIGRIAAMSKRFDAHYQIGTQLLDAEKNNNGAEQVSLASVAKRIFVGSRGRRNYVKRGIPFLSSSDMMLFNAIRESKPISKSNPGLESLLVHENDILISRSGTVGNVIIVGHDLDQCGVSEHALRLVVDERKVSPLYVFCYLKTAHAKSYMEASAYGSVIITLNEAFVGAMTMPVFKGKVYDSIVADIGEYKDKLATAADLETEAIDMVEREIESWQEG